MRCHLVLSATSPSKVLLPTNELSSSAFFCSREITRSHTAVKILRSESSQVSSELSSHCVNPKRCARAPVIPLYGRVWRGWRGEFWHEAFIYGAVTLISGFWTPFSLWIALCPKHSQGYTNSSACYQQLCMLCFLPWGHLVLELLVKNDFSPKQVRSGSWGIFQSTSLQWWKTGQEASCVLLSCGFSFQTKF